MEKYFRTFIGLPFQVEQEFLETRKDLISALVGERISWVDPDRYHVTLRFLGDTKPSLIEEIRKNLQTGVKVPGRTEIKLGGLSSFGPRKRPRVLWVGFEETSFFELMKSQVDRTLEQCGISPVEQPFRAHLTLGRVRSLKNLKEYYETIHRMAHQFQGSVLFEKLVFFRSILESGGPQYHILDEKPFR